MTVEGFWRGNNLSNQRVLTRGYGALSDVFFLAPQGDGPVGSYSTFAQLSTNLRSRSTIVLIGVLREQAVAPLNVYDVSVIGAANRPRQATSGGVPTGGGACWIPPTSPTATTPLLEIKAQGWSFENIEFSPVASSAAVRLTRSASIDTIDAGHARFTNCLFGANGATTPIGIEDNGGCGRVLIEDCRFDDLASAILSLNTAAAVPLDWTIQDCKFRRNTNDIKMSLSYSLIQRNKHFTAGSGATNKVISTTFISTQGGNNQILLNQFNNTEAQIAPGSGYTGAATDVWMNYVNDQAALAFGQPA